MSATARPLFVVPPPDAPPPSGCGVRSVDWQLKALRDAVEQRHRSPEAASLRLEGIRPHEHVKPLEAMIEWATSAGAAVARIHRSDADTSVAAFVSALSTGHAPVISPGSASLLCALHGRRAAQLRFLEGLLRRHARHRAILIVVDDRTVLDRDTAWLVQQLAGLLHDVAVTWVNPARLRAARDATIVQGAVDTRVALKTPSSRNPLSPVEVRRPASPSSALAVSVAQPPRPTAQPTHPTDPGGRHPRDPQRPRFGWLALTDTELRVVRLVVQGHTNRATAAALFVSVNTVSTHLRSVYNKLDVNSRVQLTRVALRHLSDEERATTYPPRADDEGARQ